MKVKDEQGSTLLLTMVVMLVLLLLGGTLSLYSMTNARQAQLAEYDLQAYYLARSGADALAQAIIKEPDRLEGIMGSGISEPVELGDGQGIFTVEVLQEDSNIKIVSTGVVGGITRHVGLTLKLLRENEIPDFTNAIVARGLGSSSHPSVQVSGSGKIRGRVVTNTVDQHSVLLSGNSRIKGDLVVGPVDNPWNVLKTDGSGMLEGSIESLENFVSYPAISFPDFPNDLPKRENFSTPWIEGEDYRISEDGHYDKINVTSSRTLKIDLNEGTREIRVRHITIEGPIELINVGENGRLILYVDEVFATSGGRNINFQSDGNHRPETLTVYYAGKPTFGDAHFNLCGNVIVKDAPVKIERGVVFRGSIFSGGSSVDIGGSASTKMGLIYAPAANVRVGGSAYTNAIVASYLDINGDAEVNYEDFFDTSWIPKEIFGSSSEGEAGSGYYRGFWSAGK